MGVSGVFLRSSVSDEHRRTRLCVSVFAFFFQRVGELHDWICRCATVGVEVTVLRSIVGKQWGDDYWNALLHCNDIGLH